MANGSILFSCSPHKYHTSEIYIPASHSSKKIFLKYVTLQISMPQGCFPNYAYQVIPNAQSGEIYELSAWVKSTGFPSFAVSSIELGKITGNGFVIPNTKKDTSSSTEWVFLTLIDTILFDTNESAVVVLESGTVTGPLTGNSYFDLIDLKQIVPNSIQEKKIG